MIVIVIFEHAKKFYLLKTCFCGLFWSFLFLLIPPEIINFTFTFHLHALEKEMATHSSVLAWRIPGMGEPGGLLSMGSHRHN